MPKITLHLREDESRLKDMIKALQEAKKDGNPYYKRSESEIAKMVLEPALEITYNKYLHSGESSVDQGKGEQSTN
jgi:hypothetical protein